MQGHVCSVNEWGIFHKIKKQKQFFKYYPQVTRLKK